MPNEPSPYRQTTSLSGCASLAAMANPVPTPSEPKRARIHPLAGIPRTHRLGRNGDDIAAIADVDRVLTQELVDLVGQAIGMDRALVGGEHRHELSRASGFHLAQLLHPLLSRFCPGRPVDPTGSRLRNRGQDRAGISRHAETRCPGSCRRWRSSGRSGPGSGRWRSACRSPCGNRTAYRRSGSRRRW